MPTDSGRPSGPLFDRARIAALFAVRGRISQRAQLAVVVALGLVVRLALIKQIGYRDDFDVFCGWFRAIASLRLSDVYARVPSLSYPPMIVVLFKFEALVMSRIAPGPWSPGVLIYVVKLPSMLLDCAGAALTYRIVRREAAHAWALLGAGFIAFNPALIYDCAYWGQNDAIPTVLALWAISQLRSGATIAAWITLTVALFFKSPVLVLIPLVLLYPFRSGCGRRTAELRDSALGIIAAALVCELLAVTFFPAPNPPAALHALVQQYFGASHVFGYTTLNAFNLWVFIGPFFGSDEATVLGLSLHAWGSVVFLVYAGCIYVQFLKRPDAMAVFEASALVLLALFMLMTEMHERYLYYAAFFCAALVARRPYRYAVLILSTTLVLNLEYAVTFIKLNDAHATMVDPTNFAPWLAHLCAAANLAVFARLMYGFFRDPSSAPEAVSADEPPAIPARVTAQPI